MLIEIPIFEGFKKSNPLQGCPADMENLYVANLSNERQRIYSTPGLSQDTGITFKEPGGIRIAYVSRLTENMHVVIGSAIDQVNSSLDVIHGTTITTKEGYVGVDDTQIQLLFVDGAFGYIYTKATNTYDKLIDPAFPAFPKDVAAFGGRFYVIKGGTNEIYFSGINDGKSWNTLDKFEITTYPDEAVALHVLDGRLYVFGKRVTETWVLQGGSFPIARDENLVLEYGCLAPGTIATKDGIICWIGFDKEGITSVVASIGGKPEKISIPEVEDELHSYSDIDDARGFLYVENGFLMYQLNFTIENKSWLFNFSSKKWSRLSYKENERHRAECYAYFNGTKYVGDYELPILYEFDSDFPSDNGIPIKRKVTTDVFIPKKSDPFCVKYVRTMVRQGVGTNVEEDIQPQIMLRISRDSGATFGNQLQDDIGTLGETDYHSEFYRLGYFEYGTMVFDFEFYNMVNFSLLNCFAEVTT